MKKHIILLAMILGIGNLVAQEEESIIIIQEEKTENPIMDRLNFHATLESTHLWRGLVVSESPAISGLLSYNLDKKGQWQVGLWGASGLSNEPSNDDGDNNRYTEIDYFAQFSSKYVTIGVWDLFNSTSMSDPDIWDYDKNTTGHIIDFRSNYYLGDKFPMRLQANVLLYGTADQEIDSDGDNNQKYSTYVEAAYPIYRSDKLTLNAFVGAAFALNGDTTLYGNADNNFDIVNTGLTASRDVRIGNYSLPVSGTFLWNPARKIARFQLAVNLF